MTSYIGVFGTNENGMNWMRDNYKRVNEIFKKIHPVYELSYPEKRLCTHGIVKFENLKSEDLKYRHYWDIPCHWDSSDHFIQTEKDIIYILAKLGAPKGIGIYLSPHSDLEFEFHLDELGIENRD